jgi:hypothetical protein
MAKSCVHNVAVAAGAFNTMLGVSPHVMAT